MLATATEFCGVCRGRPRDTAEKFAGDWVVADAVRHYQTFPSERALGRISINWDYPRANGDRKFLFRWSRNHGLPSREGQRPSGTDQECEKQKIDRCGKAIGDYPCIGCGKNCHQ